VLEAVQLRGADMERRLAALEPGGDAATGPRLLALRPAPGGLATPRAVPATEAARRLVRAGTRLRIVKLHLASPPSLAAESSTVTRKATRRSMPRITGVSATSTVWVSRWSPSARTVPWARALCPIGDLTRVA